MCGEALPDNWHADHVVPWSKTKTTNVHEMQALCPLCNIKKGKSVRPELRKHQSEMVGIAGEIVSRRKAGFRLLAYVVCGGGKSWLPGLLVEQMPSDIKLCWLVPRLALQKQAIEDTQKTFGITLRDAGNDINPSRGRRGVVVTHQAFSMCPELWRDEFKKNKYILLVDEPHHAKFTRKGELNRLAAAIGHTESHALGTVYMTGTLSTGDSDMIYGVEYVDDPQTKKEVACESGFDYFIRYRRADALEEKSIVPIEFFHHDGPVKWESISSGKKTEIKLSEAAKKEESNAIWTALSTDMANAMFEKGYLHWKKNGNKLLVVCHSQQAAKKWHNELLSRGEHSFLAVSENEEALAHIKAFKNKPRSCLVTCAMAYEGLDERPLSHVICLTHIRSIPWIEQMLARVWRADSGKTRCFAFVPDDPRMRRVIESIKAETPDFKSMVEEKDGGQGRGDSITSDRDAIPIESRHDYTRLSGLDESIGFLSLNQKQQEAYEKLVSIGIDPDNEHFTGIIASLATAGATGLNAELTDSEREVEICNAIAKECRDIDARIYSCQWGTMQKNLFIRNNGKSTKDMTIDELRESLSYVKAFAAR